MPSNFENKVVIVTGASRGIGGTAAISFAKEGATVIGVARSDQSDIAKEAGPKYHQVQFDLGEEIVAHFLGEPSATHSVWLHNEQSVLSPNWSIHSGCGTSAYRFIWAMGGENQTFDDMDPAPKQELK